MIIVGFAAQRGVRPPVLLEAARIEPALLLDTDAYLTHAQEIRLWEAAARLTNDPDFGLHLAEWVVQSPEDFFDVLAFALRSSPTLGDQYQRAGRYMRLIHEGIYLTLEEDQDEARLVHGHVDGRIGPRHPVEGMLTLVLLNGRRALGESFVPRAVCFSHAPPEQVTEQTRIFQAPVYYGCPRNELVLDRALLARSQRHAEPRLLTLLDRQLNKTLAELPEGRRVSDAVRRYMLDELPDQEPTVAAAAVKLRTSARSLQRSLQSEGTRFSEVLSDLRRDLALRYLQDPRISIGEVGFLLGFLDVTAFHRAFKRWTGSTPLEHRQAASRARRLRAR